MCVQDKRSSEQSTLENHEEPDFGSLCSLYTELLGNPRHPGGMAGSCALMPSTIECMGQSRRQPPFLALKLQQYECTTNHASLRSCGDVKQAKCSRCDSHRLGSDEISRKVDASPRLWQQQQTRVLVVVRSTPPATRSVSLYQSHRQYCIRAPVSHFSVYWYFRYVSLIS